MNEDCKRFLNRLRSEIRAKKEDKIDKRYRGRNPYHAPNNQIYFAHCGYCAEFQYLSDIYNVSFDTKLKLVEEIKNERT